jgi:copper transport protein
VAREAISAWYDGERCDAAPAAVAGHIASCARCTAFQRALGAVAELTDSQVGRPPTAGVVPGTSERRLARARVRLAVRLGVALAGLAALVPALVEAAGHGGHEAHESVAFTGAISVALLCAAARPALARAYVPVLVAASVLLVLTSVVDVDEGRVTGVHELRHLGVLVGCVLVALLASGDGLGRPSLHLRPRSRFPTGSARVRAISRTALPALGAAVLAALVLLVAAPASAHAELERSTPAADAVLQQPPSSVSLVFNESVTLLPDSVRVFGPGGDRVDEGSVERAHGDDATAEVGVRRGLPDGTYLVSYRVVSADSHPVAGAYTFVVGHPSTAPVAPPSGSGSSSRTVDVALGLSRALTYAGSALGLGGFAFLVWCWPTGWASRRARVLVDVGIGVLGVGTLLALVLKGPYDAGLGLSRVTDRGLLREVLGTTYGRALDGRLFLVALLVLLVTYREHVPRRVLAAAPAVLLLATGVTFALGGHAAAGGHRALAVASDTVHVTAMSLWLGGLAMLLGAVLVRGGRLDELSHPIFRFSTLATGAVTVLIATGVYQTLREVRSWDVLLHTHYGHVLVVKLGLVGLAFLAAAGSRTWVWQTVNPVVPVLAATSMPASGSADPLPDGRPSLGRLRASVGAETTMLVAVLAATAMLVTSDPAVAAPQPHPVSANLTVGPDRVHVSAVPSGPRRLQLTLRVTDAAGKPTVPKEVDASLRLPSSDIGLLPVTLTGAGMHMGSGSDMGTGTQSAGTFTGVVGVPVTGTWQLAVTVRTTAIDEATAYVDVPIG